MATASPSPNSSVFQKISLQHFAAVAAGQARLAAASAAVSAASPAAAARAASVAVPAEPAAAHPLADPPFALAPTPANSTHTPTGRFLSGHLTISSLTPHRFKFWRLTRLQGRPLLHPPVQTAICGSLPFYSASFPWLSAPRNRPPACRHHGTGVNWQG